MRVGEVAEQTGVSVRAIRHYERAGLLNAVRRPNGYREFGRESVERVRAIRDLIECGFTLDEIRSLSGCLTAADDDGEPCGPRTAALYRRKLAKIDNQARTLQRLRERIEQRLAALEPRSNANAHRPTA